MIMVRLVLLKICVPCYSFISGDDDYNALRPLIDEAYEEYCREK